MVILGLFLQGFYDQASNLTVTKLYRYESTYS